MKIYGELSGAGKYFSHTGQTTDWKEIYHIPLIKYEKNNYIYIFRGVSNLRCFNVGFYSIVFFSILNQPHS